jgi:hypothetical protein
MDGGQPVKAPRAWPLVLVALPGLAVLLAGCAPPGPDLTPFAQAIKWLGVCLVLSSLIWATGIVLFGQSRHK